MAAVKANGIALEVERHGPSTAPTLLLIRGLGSQLIHWPDALIQALGASGFHVVTFDNRDSGLSQKFGNAGGYSLRDMAEDAIGVLDALGVEQAHVLGMSMGGMILQLIALHHPTRVLSATIVMSSSLAPNLPQGDPDVIEMLRKPSPTDGRSDVIAHLLETDRAFQSPRWPFEDAARADLIGRAHDRCYCPDGVARQHAAMMAASQGLARIENITTPTLVIHGTHDRLFPLAHGRDIAERIPGATLVAIEGLGHDLHGEATDRVVGHVQSFLETIAASPIGSKR